MKITTTSSVITSSLLEALEGCPDAFDMDRAWGVSIWTATVAQLPQLFSDMVFGYLTSEERSELDFEASFDGPSHIEGFVKINTQKLQEVALAKAREAFEAEYGPIAGHVTRSVLFILTFERRVRNLSFLSMKREDHATD